MSESQATTATHRPPVNRQSLIGLDTEQVNLGEGSYLLYYQYLSTTSVLTGDW